MGVSNMLLFSFILILIIQWSGWIISCLLETETFFDVTGSGTFFLVAATTLALGGNLYARQVLVASLVGIWCVRLGPFLLLRVLKEGKDSRFDGVRDSPPWLFIFWTIQAVWIFMTLLPVILLNSEANDPKFPDFRDVFGTFLWCTGFFIEAIADFQKFQFRQIDENKEKWIDTGLWRYSRHPNYFGEILLWSGIFFIGSSALNNLDTMLGMLSPIYVTIQLVFLSGIPLLEKAADNKWGKNEAYINYKKRTPILFPSLIVRSHDD